MIGHHHAVTNAEIVKFVAGLVDQLLAVSNKEYLRPLRYRTADDLGRDDGFPAPCGEDVDNTLLVRPDLSANALDVVYLVLAKFERRHITLALLSASVSPILP